MRNTENRFSSTLTIRRLMVGLAAIGLIALSLAQDSSKGLVGKKINVRDLILPQLKKTGEKDWVLRAKEGVSSGNSFLLRTVHIIVYRTKKEGGNTEMRTPECIYDRGKKMGRSDKRVNIRTGNMMIDGIGFDLDGKRKTVVIRSRVRVKIFKNDKNLFGKLIDDAKKPSNKPMKNEKKPFVKPVD